MNVSTKIWFGVFFFCIVEVFAIYAFGLVKITPATVLLQLTAWAGGGAFVALAAPWMPARVRPQWMLNRNTRPPE